jgi:hypothetical protein
VGEEGHRVDAIRQGANVSPSRALGQLLGLIGVEQVANQDRHRRSRKHAAVDQLRREAEHESAEGVDEEELDEVVEGQAEEPVDVARDHPTHARRIAQVRGLAGRGCPPEAPGIEFTLAGHSGEGAWVEAGDHESLDS